MTTVAIPAFCRKALISKKYSRNGFAPDAQELTFFQEEANRLARYRVKEIGSFSCPIDAIPAVSAVRRIRWRSAFHSSPLAKYIWADLQLAISNQYNGAGVTIVDASLDPFGKLLVEDSVGTDIGFIHSHYGSSPIPPADLVDAPSYFRSDTEPLNDLTNIVTISGDTDYFVTLSDEQSARLIGANIWEVSALPDTANGYLQSGVVVDSPIFDEQRRALLAMLRTNWKRGPAHLWNWASNTDATAPTTNTGVDKNVIDPTVTAVSVASPGPTLDLAHHSTVRRVTVPVTMWVYGKTTATTGTVKLKDSSGTTLASVVLNSAVAGWHSTTFNLPASVAKYDPTYNVTAGIGTTTVYAISLYQHEA
jgi:hypothetical protein